MMHLPKAFTEVPESLRCCNAPTTHEELALADSVRKEYLMPGTANTSSTPPFMLDVCRAFRVAKGAKVYVEIGTQDKGNIAWVARTKLSSGATIIDIDMLDYPEHDKKIAAELGSDFDYHSIRGDCLSKHVLDQVKAILNGRSADVIFGDSHYTYEHTLAEFSLYYPLVKQGGFMMFHDSEWVGGDHKVGGEFAKKGKGLAIMQLDRFYPAWTVFGADRPLHRPLPTVSHDSHWGTLAIFPV
jgi:hypothetical protein